MFYKYKFENVVNVICIRISLTFIPQITLHSPTCQHTCPTCQHTCPTSQ